MRRLLISTAVLAATFGTANAADLGPPPPPLYDIAPVSGYAPQPFDGAYIGINGGAASGEFSLSDPNADLLRTTLAFPIGETEDFEGWTLGGTVGVNTQIDSVVLGLEADLNYTDINGSAKMSQTDGFFDTDLEVGADFNYLGTLRGRIGYAFDRFMLYGTGGVAVAEIEQTAKFDMFWPTGAYSSQGSSKERHLGWTLGAGVEGMLTQNLSAKIEYLYADLGKQDYNTAYPPGYTVDADLDLTMHLVRGGLNYKFLF